MFEAKCPSCNASYQVDERRVPPKGLKMRCPKCGESFQVTAPGQSEPPVLGAALGLKGSPPKPRHKATMLGMPDQPKIAPPPAAPPRPLPPRAGVKKTMLGVAPAGSDDGLELANLDEDLDEVQGLDADELDLSAPQLGSEFDPARQLDELDEVDLPVPSPRSRRSPGQIDLPGGEEEAELPVLVRELPDLDAEVDLPDLSANLPSPRGDDLPDLGGNLPEVLGADLPDLGAGLPELGGNLPSLGAGLPAPRPKAGESPGKLAELDPFGELEADEFDLGSNYTDADEAAGRPMGLDLSGPPPARDSISPAGSADDIFGHGATHAPQSVRPRSIEEADPTSLGEENPGGAGERAGNLDVDEFDAFPTDDSAGGGASTEGGGYGDVALDGGGGASFDLGDDEGGAQFRSGPSSGPRGGAAATARVELPGKGRGGADVGASPLQEKKKRRKTTGLSKGTRIAIGAALILAIAGGALSLMPDIGPYGAYYILDTIKADDYRAQLASDIEQVGKLLNNDTATDVSRAFAIVDTGRKSAPRYDERAAYTAYIGFLHKVRFGADTSESAQAEVLLQGLAEIDPTTQYLDLARLAKTAADGKFGEVVGGLSSLVTRGVEYAVVVGEAALALQDAGAAEKAWQAVLSKGSTPRSHFGLARVRKLEERAPEARAEVDKTLQLNPAHAGARLLLAEMQVRAREHDEEIVKNLTPLSLGQGASAGEQVRALVILGDLHLSRARLKKAEASFTQALKLDGGNALAQRGLAQTLFQSGRYSEALARFEAALQKSPKDLETRLGLVESKLRLEQLDDAVKILAQLNAEHPNSTAVSYWVGRGKEAVGEKEAAEKAYELAIKQGDDVSELVRAYIALTRLLSQRGNLDEADEVIRQAEQRFPDDPAIYEALGELSSSRGSYDEAVQDYDRALALDPTNIGLRFARGIALRQARRFKEAEQEFALVEKESADYPGLALERGNLYEASGRTEEALKQYEAALAAAPDDLDLKLRVACGRASAGQSEPALELLAPVLEERANSAEANFCKGLAILNGGEDLNVAKQFLIRAVGRDPSRAKYHLYVGWVAMELGDLSQATLSFDKAIELDRTLADAYWKRGELRVRSGAVVDALADLARSLDLSPSRLEAHAAAARAYEQIGKEQEALDSWSKAVAAEVVDPVWNYQYGELLYVNRREAEAREQLKRAVEGGEKAESPPVWLADAHRYYAMALGRGKPALEHWKRYLDLKKDSNDPYKKDALREIDAILKTQGF